MFGQASELWTETGRERERTRELLQEERDDRQTWQGEGGGRDKNRDPQALHPLGRPCSAGPQGRGCPEALPSAPGTFCATTGYAVAALSLPLPDSAVTVPCPQGVVRADSASATAGVQWGVWEMYLTPPSPP